MSDNALTTSSDNGGKATAIYILYLAGFVTGGVTTLIGLIMAYVFKGDTEEWLVSHYDNAINIFWKSVFWFVIFVPAIIFFAITIVLIPAIIIFALGLVFVLPVWYIVRCVKGLNYISKGYPYPQPGSWGF